MAEQSRRITSLSLLDTLFLMNSNIPLAFLATRAHWWLMVAVVLQDSQVILCRAPFQQVSPWSVLISYSSPAVGLSTFSLWTSSGSSPYNFPACPGLVGLTAHLFWGRPYIQKLSVLPKVNWKSSPGLGCSSLGLETLPTAQPLTPFCHSHWVDYPLFTGGFTYQSHFPGFQLHSQNDRLQHA